MTNIVSPKSTRTVTFAEFSQLSFIPRDDAKSKWHSPQEKQKNREKLVQDTRRMQNEISTKSEEVITKDQLYECIGIELFLSQGLMRHVAQVKHAHVKAVLSEQRLQEQHGVRNPEKLQDVSRKTSRWSRNRARKLAAGYIMIMQE